MFQSKTITTGEPDEPSRAFRFVRTRLDRRSDLRENAVEMAARAADPRARFVIFVADRPIVREIGDRPSVLLERVEAEAFAARLDESVFLGDGPEGPVFAAVGEGDEAAVAATGRTALVDLRALAVAERLEATEYGALATARTMLFWHHGHRFCGRCGAPTRIGAAGWRRDCPACGAQHFPRTDPVVIMLITDGDRALLGRSARFAPGMYSCLAGFMEPGETVEAAVRRETFEESGIRVGRIRYFASEPWPFPASLMIGVFGRALTREIVCDPVELVDCRWFSRGEVAAMFEGTHPDGIVPPQPIAIAHHLLRRFVGCDDPGDLV
jgi:NAD+ diphosphatase